MQSNGENLPSISSIALARVAYLLSQLYTVYTVKVYDDREEGRGRGEESSIGPRSVTVEEAVVRRIWILYVKLNPDLHRDSRRKFQFHCRSRGRAEFFQLLQRRRFLSRVPCDSTANWQSISPF